MNAIFQREWRSYFNSPIGYIFTGVFIALCSFFFVNGALMYQSADLDIVFSNINIVYLFLISMLTMGLFSVERSRKTDKLLLVSPVSVPKIVLGKYLAAMGVFGTTLILSLIYPIILNIFGSPSQGEILGTYIGFILLWGSFIAIGTFISSLTENQIIAAVVTFGVLLVVYCINSFAANISNETVRAIILKFSLTDRYGDFESGILNFENVIYYISFIFVFLLLTSQVIRNRQFGEIGAKLNNMIVTAALIVAIIIFNAIVSAAGTKIPLKVDLTYDGVYEYSSQTKDVLNNLNEDVTVYALYPNAADDVYSKTSREHLENYSRMSGKIKVEYHDPYEEPAFVKSFGDNVETGSLIVSRGSVFRVIQFSNLYTQNQYTGTVSTNAENLLTSAIQYVSGNGKDVYAYFIKNHGEYAGCESQLANTMEAEGYTVSDLNISSEGIPEDASLLISMSPSVDFTSYERDVIDNFLQNGGKAAFVFTAGTQKLERLYSYLDEWGICVNGDYVIEKNMSRAIRSQTGTSVPTPTVLKHKSTENLTESDIPVVTPAACSFTLSGNNTQFAKTVSLLQTSNDSYGITDISSGRTEKTDADIEGPLTVAAISEKTDNDGGGIFVFGSLGAIETVGVLEDASYNNGDFVLNVLSYLTDKGDTLNIRAKKISAETLSMTETQIKICKIIVQYVIPVIIILIGFIIWIRRRYL